MKTLELKKASPSVRKTARMAKGGVLVLTENGKPAFALVGLKDELALEALALSRNEKFMAYLAETSEQARQGTTYSLKEMREEFIPSARPRKRRRKID